MFEDTSRWKRDPAITGTILFFLLISPMGAPLLGLITIGACGIRWEAPYQCMVPESLFAYFMFFMWAPFFWLGLFALPWFAISIGLVMRFAWMFASAAWAALVGD
jgi:hypothetical protein